MFDPNAFLEQVVAEVGSTEATPIPAGEYLAFIDKKEVTTWQKKDDPTVSGVKLKITWVLEDQAVRDLLGRDKVTVAQDIMLDITDTGGLDMGKGRNIGLGRLREALDLNQPGRPFSFTMLSGRVAKVNVSHRIADDNIFAEVKQVARI